MLNPVRNKTEFGTIRDCNTNSHKWSVVKAAMLCGAYPNLARVDESARHGIKIVTDQAKTYMMDYQSVCAKVTRQRHTKYHWFIFEEISQQLRGRVEQFVSVEKLVFAITFKILRIPTDDIELKDSSDSKLQIESIFSIRILIILEVITKKSFS